jgi:hypothetical protein
VGASTAWRDSIGISPDDQPQTIRTPRQEEAIMSPHQHYQIARAHQQEIVDRALNAHRIDAGERCRTIKYRLVRTAAVLGVCGAAGTAVAVSNAQSHQPHMTQNAAHVSAQRYAREIRAFETKGYVPTSCTVSGTLMRNYRTGKSVTVKL